MFRNSKGAYIVDVMIGLSVLILVLSTMMPILYQIYLEKLTINEERYAIGMLNNELQRWISAADTAVFKDSVVLHNHTTYNLSWSYASDKVQLCIFWEAINRRNYNICGKAK